jgi:uncharacterized protein
MLKLICILLIKGYQKIFSPYLGACCRFYPTCSAYALQAYQKHGFIKGSYLTIKRLAKCHPFHKGGKDLVP